MRRILASETFARSERLSSFLRFVVEKTVAGDSTQLKEYLLGAEVFDKGEDFDPRLDPSVRVEARRLRLKLQEYYEGPGCADPVRIRLPKGGYVPAFESATEVTLPARVPRRRFALLWTLGTAAALSGAALTAWRIQSNRVAIAVIPYVDSAEESFGDQLAETVAAELTQNPALRVESLCRVPPSSRRHRRDSDKRRNEGL